MFSAMRTVYCFSGPYTSLQYAGLMVDMLGDSIRYRFKLLYLSEAQVHDLWGIIRRIISTRCYGVPNYQAQTFQSILPQIIRQMR